MRKYSKTAKIGKMIVFGLLAGTIFTFALMFLWNWLMPLIFGLTVITFWQALGLLALSKILFGRSHKPNWRGRDKSAMHKDQFMTRFGKRRCYEDVTLKNQMSDEEK